MTLPLIFVDRWMLYSEDCLDLDIGRVFVLVFFNYLSIRILNLLMQPWSLYWCCHALINASMQWVILCNEWVNAMNDLMEWVWSIFFKCLCLGWFGIGCCLIEYCSFYFLKVEIINQKWKLCGNYDQKWKLLNKI